MTGNCTGGIKASATDENSQPTTYAYSTDPDFWRPNSVTDAASNVANLTYSGANTSDAALNFNGTTSTVNTLTTLDDLGRNQLSQKRESQSSTVYDSIETDYDDLGRPSRTTLPFQAGAGVTSSTAPG